MDKGDYINKMNSILNNPTKFRKLNDVKDINKKAEKLLTNSLKESLLQPFTIHLNPLDRTHRWSMVNPKTSFIYV